jgi:hypothetical protein
MADTYTATEAAKVLKVSPRRIRQLVEAGRLIAIEESPLRVSQLSVVALKEERKEQPKQRTAKASGARTKQPPLSELVAALSEARAAGAAEARAALELVTSEQRERAERAEQRAAEAEAALRVADSERAVLASQLEALRVEKQRKKFLIF